MGGRSVDLVMAVEEAKEQNRLGWRVCDARARKVAGGDVYHGSSKHT